jgi:hypothetical protein
MQNSLVSRVTLRDETQSGIADVFYNFNFTKSGQ